MLFRAPDLPTDPLNASARFHAEVLPAIRSALEAGPANLTIVFAPAGHEHSAWRLAAVQALARQAAPLRVNAVESDDEPAIAAASAYLGDASGVTGQLLPLDGTGAGPVLYSKA